MTAQYTATTQILPSNVMADALSSKIDVNKLADSEAFSSALNNATKNYADKSETKTSSAQDSVDYSTKTKECNKTDKTKVVETADNVKEHKTDATKTESTKVENDSAKISEKHAKESLESVVSDKTTVEKTTEDIAVVDDNIETSESEKTVEQLLEEIKLQAIVAVDETKVATITPKAEENVQKTNKIVVEQIVSNVEFDKLNTDSVELKNLDLATIKSLDSETLQKLIDKAKSNLDENLKQLNLDDSSVKQSANAVVQDSTSVLYDVEIKLADGKTVKLEELQKQVDAQLKQLDNTKLSLENHKLQPESTAKLVINIDEQLQRDALVDDVVKEVKAVLPSETVAEDSPRIKVTENVVSQVKETFNTVIENKDNTSKIKDKAVNTMTALQDENILVTDTKSQDMSNSNMGFGQNNAGETAIKLAVETNTFNSQQAVSAESFVNKLDVQLAARESIVLNSSLNQSDILSQVTSKFEQLQQQNGNKVSIVLQPESLGKVSVEIMNTKDGIVAKMTTDSQQVKELFDKSIESLKSNLSAQGVNVNNIKVECAHESANNAMNFERDQFNQAFNNQQNGQGNTNKSEQNVQNSYGSDVGSLADENTEEQESSNLKNTDTIIKHNGKVDYSV